ncbi:hypothetical protein UC34_10935 [Pandoraea vervacti]|uniref:DUF1853 domain-containing protein n=1 Tax=Pandoraea vervacti TaxID=656178 RepID=A0ABM6FQZ1_9BURK|nr:DUF1853 family protein [Pandoraea vervacti]APD11230.1 hypothetical protein UC34_10935 [Pandoraea vervacti]
MRNDSGQQAYGELIETLREAPVRDLAWLLLSADLLSAARFPAALAHFDSVQAAADVAAVPPLGMPPDTRAAVSEPVFHSRFLHDWLLACDADPEPLREMLARGESHRLGRYAEQLLHFALLHSPRFDLLGAGLQVRDARRGNMTLGECDFLLARREDRQLLHWELAVKLYLFVPPEPSLGSSAMLDERAIQFHWLGPNLADSLADKVARLLGHQLRLTSLDAARSALPAPGPWLPQVYLKGWLFHPLEQRGTLPQVASETHGRGWWATLDEWWMHAQQTTRQTSRQPQAWAMLPRARWLAPARVAASGALPLDAMRARIESHWRERGVAEPLLIVSLTRRARNDQGGDEPADGASDWFECERGFIVPDFWAPRARHRIEELRERADAAARRALAQTADDGAPSI